MLNTRYLSSRCLLLYGSQLLVLFAMLLVAPSMAVAQSSLSLSQDMVLDSDALLMPRSATYGPAINGLAHQTEALLTYGDYQYTTWYHLGSADEDVYLARRAIGSTSWEVMDTGYNFDRGDDSWDNHNAISMGVSGDGTIHLSWDHHGNTLRYLTSVAGAATGSTWDASILNSERSSLNVGGTSISTVTYPRFAVDSNTGNMQLSYRTGSSGNGDIQFATYDTDTGLWDTPHEVIDGQSGTYSDAVGSSSNRNAYLNGYDTDASGRIHTTWTWRESAGGSNHDIMYAYSDDGGDTWKNNDGVVVGTVGSPITLDSPGITVVSMDRRNTLMNQQTQIVDSDGAVHSVMWHASDDNANAVSGFDASQAAYFHYYREPGQTLLADYFDGTGSILDGSTPDVSTTSATWEAGGTYFDNGQADTTVADSPTGEAAHLDFTPEAGKVYTAEATILNNQSNWVGFGFLPEDSSTTDWTATSSAVRHSNAPGYAWMLSRNSDSNDQEAFLGSGTDGAQSWNGDLVDPTESIDMKVVLDTTEDNWTVEWFLNGVSQGDPVAYSTTGNPGIGGIGFSHDRSDSDNDGASITNFSLKEGDNIGDWIRNELPTEREVGSRPDMATDADGNLYAVYVSPGEGDGEGLDQIYTNGDLIIATASKATRWQDWEIVYTGSDLDFIGEPQLDQTLLEQGILSIFVQENGDNVGTETGTPLHVFEFNALANNLVWDGNASNNWQDADTQHNWDSQGYDEGDSSFSNAVSQRVTFDDGADSFAVNITSTVTPSSMIFRNATNAYTFTGGGISGSGDVRLLGGGTVTFNNGANTYTGDTSIETGTLALAGSGTISQSPHIQIDSGASLDVSQLNSTFTLAAGQTLTNNSSTGVVGDMIASSDSAITANSASFGGSLSMQAGSTLQVGGIGLNPSDGNQVVVLDDFSSNTLANYTSTVILDNEPWNGANSASWQVEDGGLVYSTTWYRSIEQSALISDDTSLEVGEEILLEVDHTGASQDIGLYVGGTTPSDNVRQDYIAVYARGNGQVLSRGFDGTNEYSLVSGGTPTFDTLFIARTGSNTYEVGYYNGDSRTVLTTRTPTTANSGDVVGFYTDVRSSGTLGTLDNFAKLLTGTSLQGDTLTIAGDLNLEAGSLTILDIGTSGISDSISIAANFAAGGTLEIDLDESLDSLTSLTLGSSWTLFDFLTSSGSFESFLLPALASGLYWDTTQLLVDGTLSISDTAFVLAGDFNGDGTVDLADYTLWRNNLGSVDSVLAAGSTTDGSGYVDAGDFLTWKANLGTTSPVINQSIAAVPEPSTLLLLAGCLVPLAWRRR